jgi:putative FmdB family regulatory protein
VSTQAFFLRNIFFAEEARDRPDQGPALKIDKAARINTGSFFPEERILPLYEYRCTACGYSFEKIQSFSAKPETECPKCQGVLIRPVTAPALRFAGAGWYVNDYAGKGGAKSGDAAGVDGTDGAASKNGNTESKPDSGAGSAESKPSAPTAAPVAAAATPSASSASTSGS